MKKAVIAFATVAQTILRYFTIVIDRLVMAPFIGVPLPEINHSKQVPVVDEFTTNEEIEDIVDLEDSLTIKYFKEYLPKARRRTLRTIAISTTIYIFTLVSWTTVFLTLGTGAVAFSVTLLIQYLIKRAKNKSNERNNDNNLS